MTTNHAADLSIGAATVAGNTTAANCYSLERNTKIVPNYTADLYISATTAANIGIH